MDRNYKHTTFRHMFFSSKCYGGDEVNPVENTQKKILFSISEVLEERNTHTRPYRGGRNRVRYRMANKTIAIVTAPFYNSLFSSLIILLFHIINTILQDGFEGEEASQGECLVTLMPLVRT